MLEGNAGKYSAVKSVEYPGQSFPAVKSHPETFVKTLPPIGTEVRVRWLDSTSMASWKYRKVGTGFNESAIPIMTIGRLIGETPTSISVCASCGEEDDGFVGYLDPLIIPRGCIIEMRRL